MPLALLALAVGAFGIGTTEFVMMGLLPDVADDLHISIPTAGHLVSAYALGVVIGAPLLAAATARMSRRTVLISLMGLFVVGNALSAFAPDHHWLLAARFLSGLPHGAFFGVGAVVATGLVAPERKARSVSLMFLGLTVANIIGVPVATAMGQHLGWRATFLGVSVIGVAAIASLFLLIPHDRAHASEGGLRGELAALRSLPVWLALGTTVAGFGALFSAYSYITPMLTDSAGYAEGSVTLLLALFGVGATAGNLLGGRLADHSLRGTLFGGLVSLVAVLALFPVLMGAQWSAAVGVDPARHGGLRHRLAAPAHGHGEGRGGTVPRVLREPGRVQPRERRRRLDRRARPGRGLRRDLAGRRRSRARGPGDRGGGHRVRGGPEPHHAAGPARARGRLGRARPAGGAAPLSRARGAAPPEPSGGAAPAPQPGPRPP